MSTAPQGDLKLLDSELARHLLSSTIPARVGVPVAPEQTARARARRAGTG
jgi:hypothetical protein